MTNVMYFILTVTLCFVFVLLIHTRTGMSLVTVDIR